MIDEKNITEKKKSHFHDRDRIKVLVAILMFIIGLMFILYPIVAKRYNESVALKANSEYEESHSMNYDEYGEIVTIP